MGRKRKKQTVSAPVQPVVDQKQIEALNQSYQQAMQATQAQAQTSMSSFQDMNRQLQEQLLSRQQMSDTQNKQYQDQIANLTKQLTDIQAGYQSQAQARDLASQQQQNLMRQETAATTEMANLGLQNNQRRRGFLSQTRRVI